MKKHFVKNIKDKLTIPKQSKLKISQKNNIALRIVSSIILLVGLCNSIYFRIEFHKGIVYNSFVYFYYNSITIISFLSVFSTFLTAKKKNYLLSQTLLVIITSIYIALIARSLFYEDNYSVNLISIYMACLLITIVFEVNPIYHLITMTFIEAVSFYACYKGLTVLEASLNNFLFCSCITVFGFYKRYLTVRNETQRLKIQEQNRQLELNNIELEKQNDNLLLNKKYLETEVFNQSQKIQLQNQRLIRIQNNTIISLSNLIENRDEDTGEHVLRTRDYVEIIANKAYLSGEYEELTEEKLRLFVKAAPMHDIGKIVVPDAVLKKQGKLTEEEYELIKMHTIKGGKIVEDVLGLTDDKLYVTIAKEIATCHHEKYDGTGYPQGLKGQEIPLSARIMALADVFDALVSPRCYKEPIPLDTAFDIIQKESGFHFDPVLTDLFIQSKNEVITVFNKYQ